MLAQINATLSCPCSSYFIQTQLQSAVGCRRRHRRPLMSVPLHLCCDLPFLDITATCIFPLVTATTLHPSVVAPTNQSTLTGEASVDAEASLLLPLQGRN
jgi:hypothetical protein